jgi:hypothetical protein
MQLESEHFDSFSKTTCITISSELRSFAEVGDAVLVKHVEHGWAIGLVLEAEENEVALELQLNGGVKSVRVPISKISAVLIDD